MSSTLATTPPRPTHMVPRLTLFRPTDAALSQLTRQLHTAPFTYEHHGATRDSSPPGWNQDTGEVLVGQGETCFERAVVALQAWRMFELPWLHLHAPDPPEPGAIVVFASHQFGVWSTNACRVVYTDRTADASGRTAGFAYGTLPVHAVRGEERFTVCWNRDTDEVHFRIRQFSLPNDWLTKALAPLARRVQNRFVREATLAMREALR